MARGKELKDRIASGQTQKKTRIDAEKKEAKREHGTLIPLTHWISLIKMYHRFKMGNDSMVLGILRDPPFHQRDLRETLYPSNPSNPYNPSNSLEK